MTALSGDPQVTSGWLAPTATRPVDAVVTLPGSKSITNRALVLGALADSEIAVRRPLVSRDTRLMAAALSALGSEVGTDDGEAWSVSPLPRHGSVDAEAPRAVSVDVGNAGTVLRFTPPLATLGVRPVSFDGDDAVRRRPLLPLLAALRTLGADIDGDRAPFVVNGRGGLAGGEVAIDASASSQLVSALLLVAPATERGVTIRHIGERPVPNASHLAMTATMLRDRGVTVDDSTAGAWRVEPGTVAGHDELVEPDLSSAAPFLAAAVATGGTSAIPGWPERSTQPGGRLPELLAAFGARSSLDGDTMRVEGTGVICGADLDLRDCGELTPVLAALAALATTPSRLLGVDYLRGHETDRLAALTRELSGLGAEIRELDDGLEITPRPLRGNVFHSYDDHRLVMAAAVIGLVVPGVVVDDVATVAKTFPEFAQAWTSLVSGGGRR